MHIHPLALKFYEKRLNEFWSRFEKRGECWIWPGTQRYGGYGETEWFGKRHVAVHRLAWELTHHKQIPEKMFICHRCDVRECANPAHLFLGSNSDNMKDMWGKGRGRIPSAVGENNPRAKITEDMVRDIRRERTAGMSRLKLAAKYGVTPGMIGHIINGRAWTHVI